ncbi:hypothetical protein [Chitinimonas sp. BJB300]|uniref:hypothetical protein n=1 Tax=Chitinimonas sp. BJB300 TaxID=1559339 RepID=UPI000C0C9703|nr:hypothetical protein [Chitinimonas sp. BJB300]PHV09767.1 hypothetical protein CSQ89_19865 [Chitinimonas sp. BJB300]TSJ83751.1 hypothetical protein FG002_021030 [Chitinimonas sp. BJB300]
MQGSTDTIQDTGKAQRQYGLIRHYTYLNGDPCLVIRPVVPRLGATAFAVRQDDIWRWRTDVEDVRMVVHAAIKASNVLRLDHTPQTWTQIITVIQDGLDELHTMPPAPKEKRQVVGELEVFANGRRFTKDIYQ